MSEVSPTDGPFSTGSAGTAGSLVLVDDDERFRTRLARALRRRGFDVSEAGSVGEALALRGPFTHALVDLRIDGAEVRVRRNESGDVWLRGAADELAVEQFERLLAVPSWQAVGAGTVDAGLRRRVLLVDLPTSVAHAIATAWPSSSPKSMMWNVNAVPVMLSAITGMVTAQNRRSRTASDRVRSSSVPMTTGAASSPSGCGSATPPSMTRPDASGLTR